MRNSWIIWYAICLHWLWGVLLLSSPTPLEITAIAASAHLGLASASHLGILYLTVAFLALLGLAAPRGINVIMLIPQQIILVISAFGAIRAMALGTFADGVLRPVPFLIADQAPAVLAAFFHILAVYTSYLFPVERT